MAKPVTAEKKAFALQWLGELMAYYNYQVKPEALHFWTDALGKWELPDRGWEELARRVTSRYGRREGMPLIADLLDVYHEMLEELQRHRETERMREMTSGKDL